MDRLFSLAMLKIAAPCVGAFTLFGVAETIPMDPLEKLTLVGVLLLIIGYLLTQGRSTLDKFATALTENTTAVRRVVKRIERVERMVIKSKSRTDSDAESEPAHDTTLQNNNHAT